uniref:Exostosin domain-containing protein n=1 Tax=Macrostomum lignano TaxID=282301 RepID=A0A1I8FI29_9PLAT
GSLNISLSPPELIVTDLPWFFDLLESLALSIRPGCWGSLLTRTRADAGVWSEAHRWPRHFKAAGPHLRRILADSGALVPLAPLRRSAEDERLFLHESVLRWPAAGKPWTGRCSPTPSCQPRASCLPRSTEAIVRPVERALPALFGLTSRLGQLCRCSASGFVRSLWGRRDCRCSRD